MSAGKITEPMPTFHKACLRPLEWEIQCPVCAETMIVDACENNDAASWHADNGDQFPACDKCGALIEVMPVQVVNFSV